MSKQEQDTQFDARGNFKQGFFVSKGSEYQVGLVADSHLGKKRRRNEDHFAVFRRTRTCEMLISNLPSDDVADVESETYGLLVADGMGGAEFGDFASQLAIETIFQASGLATSWVMKFKDLDSQSIRERTAAYVDRIQEAFRHYGSIDLDKNRMGTTLTAAYMIPPHVIISNIGDSRAYLYSKGILTQLTRDQTLAQSLIDAGAARGAVSGLHHVLVNSLGGRKDHVDADVLHVEMTSGDRILLCTDGLSDMVDDEKIAAALTEDSLQTSCDELIDMALEAGGRDNITLIIGEITAT